MVYFTRGRANTVCEILLSLQAAAGQSDLALTELCLCVCVCVPRCLRCVPHSLDTLTSNLLQHPLQHSTNCVERVLEVHEGAVYFTALSLRASVDLAEEHLSKTRLDDVKVLC